MDTTITNDAGLDTSDRATQEVLIEANVNPDNVQPAAESGADFIANVEQQTAQIIQLRPADGAADAMQPPQGEPADLTVYGPNWYGAKCACDSVGLDYVAMRDRMYAAVKPALDRETEQRHILGDMVPADQQSAVGHGLEAIHQIETLRALVLGLYSGGQISEAALMPLSDLLIKMNAEVVTFVGAALRQSIVDIAHVPEEQFKQVILPAINDIINTKRDVMSLLNEASMQMTQALQAAGLSITHVEVKDVGANDQLDAGVPTDGTDEPGA